MQTQFESGLVWFRRDLRLQDNAALSLALHSCRRVFCAFLFDSDILNTLPRQDRRVEFIRESLVELDAGLRERSGKPEAGLICLFGRAPDQIPQLAQQLGVNAVFTARDYEPAALERDTQVEAALASHQISLLRIKDHTIFEAREVLTQANKPYTVFTPYKRAWLARIGESPVPSHGCETNHSALAERPPSLARGVPALAELGFERSNLGQLRIPTGMSGAQALLKDFLQRIDSYDTTRDFPSIKGPSYLSVHLRFGSVSIRELVNLALERHRQGSPGASTWLGELIWRDFYFQILTNFPHAAHGSFKAEYDRIQWEDGERAVQLFAAWKNGQTGYPLVDAAMAQLNQTGYMHNRLRMVAGSFLVKHLGIDWRWGERYFAEVLNDFDLSANNGGWQWVSSSGCDAQPYFRIFNPVTQSEKFDAQGKFIKRYLPQLGPLAGKALHAPWLGKASEMARAGVVLGDNYPHPVVDHAQARSRTLLRYGVLATDPSPRGHPEVP